MPPARPTLLVVFAHPDDESFGIGGTLAYYARRGVAVHLICATRGEAGTLDPHFLEGYASIAERRTAELTCAAQALGLTQVHYLEHRDSGMTGAADNTHPQAFIQQPLEQVANQVADIIRQVQPQVVITFDPIGGYKHPDHIHIHKATLLAYQQASDPGYRPDGLPPFTPSRLYFSIFPKTMLKWAVRLMPLFGHDPRRVGRNKDIDIESLVREGNFPWHVRINYASVADVRDQASLCHASQLSGGLRRGPMAWARRLVGEYDFFMQAIPAAATRHNDLFAGLE